MYICGECEEPIEDFMFETYEMFIDAEPGIEEYLCAECLHEVIGDE